MVIVGLLFGSSGVDSYVQSVAVDSVVSFPVDVGITVICLKAYQRNNIAIPKFTIRV